MRALKIAILLVLIFFLTAPRLEAQSDHKHQTYLKGGVFHTETQIEDFSIVVKGISVDLETYFNKSHLGLSGWFVGYRKDDRKYADFGHLFNGGVVRTADVSGLDLKFNGGVEWGLVSPNFMRTRSSYKNGVLVSYEHLFPRRNTDIPALGPSHDSVWYPFFEVGLLKRWEWFLVEAGVRGSVLEFGFDKYTLNGDRLVFASSDKNRLVPSAFVKLGLALGGHDTNSP